MVRRRVGLLLVTAILALLAIGVVAVWFQISLTTPRAHNAAESSVTIEPGMGTRQIVNRLGKAGLVSDETPLLVYLVATGQAKQLKAGNYEFDSPISPLEVVDKIRRGEVATKRVTIPEGYNRFDVAETLAEKTGLATREQFVQLTSRPNLIRDLDPDAGSLEGYLFPDTYEYTNKTTAEELVEQMVSRFRGVYKPEWHQQAAAHGLTIHEVATLASIIEEEAQVDEERPVISSVFHNRLAKNMRLASDPTFIYAAILSNDYDNNVNNPRHRRRLSPYNTYEFAGLPPGPIANPGRESLEAALFPAKTEYLYFVVSGTDGRHKFSRTVDEHDAAVAEYRRLQQQERREQGSGTGGSGGQR